MQATRIFIKVILLYLMTFGTLYAQRESQWYQQHDKGNRYEGSYIDKISGGLVDIISFYGGLPQYEFGNGERLKINYYAPQSSPRYLKAEELQIIAYYWMEAKPDQAQKGWNSFDNWPVDTELRKAGVKAENLAVLLRLGGMQSRTLAPAWVNDKPKSGEEINYFAYFRIGLGIRRAKFEVYRGNYQDKLIPEIAPDYEGYIGKKSGGSYFPVIIPVSSLGTKEGWITVKISFAGRRPSDHIPDFEFYFYHKAK